MNIPFPAEAAAWIRAHAWTAGMRKIYKETPGFYTACACQFGTTTHCATGHCDRCHRATPLRDYATVIALPGNRCAYFPEPYAHLTDVSATGPRYEDLAMVWLADRVCRWVCPHACHAAPAAPEQLDLFAEAS